MSSQLRADGRWRSWLGTVLDCNGDGHLAMMEHEAGIERVIGHRLKSGRGYGSGMGLVLGINSQTNA